MLAARIAEYDPAWLDHLFLSGEVVWGRLNRPRRDDDEPPSMAALTRVVPISLVLREELPTAAAARTSRRAAELRSARAGGARSAGQPRGACSSASCCRDAAACPAIWKKRCASWRPWAWSRPTRSRRCARSPAATRATVAATRPRDRCTALAAPIGRWSLFPGPVAPASREKYLDAWCRQLLARYGVVFRDLLVRETSAPSWQDLVGTLRRMELRGEVRGGRFVSRVAGEQYALSEAVEPLRQAARSRAATEPWIVISAADPLNLFGVITPGPRIPATHRNALVVQAGPAGRLAHRRRGRILRAARRGHPVGHAQSHDHRSARG